MTASLAVGLALFAVSAPVAVLGSERKQRILLVAGKPVATAALLLVAGPPTDLFRQLVFVGLVFSVIGDAALIDEGDRALLIGMAAFLVTHALYIVAFVRMHGPDASALLGGVPALAAAGVLLAALWPGIAGRLRAPVALYATAIAGTVMAACGTRGGPLAGAPATSAAVGAYLFFVGDASLAWHRFRSRIPHSALLTLGVYWLGQLGIALAARGAPG